MLNRYELPEAEEVDVQNTGIRVLLIGETGVGKTSVAASCAAHADLSPVLVADSDFGLSSVTFVKGLRRADGSSAEKLFAISQELLKPDGTRRGLYNGVKTLVIDSLSALRDQALMEEARRAALAGKRLDGFTSERQDWLHLGNMVRESINQLRRAGFNIIMTAGVNSDVANGITVKEYAGINDNLRKSIEHMCDWIFPVVRNGDKFGLLIAEREGYPVRRARARNHKLQKALIDLTIKQGTERGMKPEEAKGWYFRTDPEEPTLSIFYDLYLQVGD